MEGCGGGLSLKKQPIELQITKIPGLLVKNAIMSVVMSITLKLLYLVLKVAIIVGLIIAIIYITVGVLTVILTPPKEEGKIGVGIITEIQYADYINRAAKKYKVNPALIAGVIKQESGFQKLAYNSHSKASGLMQLIPGTAKEMGVKDPFDPEQNIMGGTKYLAQLLKRYKGNEKLALAGYNAGPGNVDADLRKGGDGIPDFAETQAYVPNVLSHKKTFQKLVEDGQIQLVESSVKGSKHSRYPYKNANTAGVDSWGFYNRQCTSFVAWRLNDVGIPFHNTMKNGRFGNAENWARNAKKLGYTVNKKAKPGAVAQWDSGAFGHSGYGHVAYVTKVEGPNITIEEYNYRPYSFSTRTIPSSQVSNYIHFK